MKHVHLNYGGRLTHLRSAVDEANRILANPEFYKAITSYKKFANSHLSPTVIARVLQESNYQIKVQSNWILPLSFSNCFDCISISRWNFTKDLPKAVNHLIYETVSSVDNLYNILHEKKQPGETLDHTACWVIGTIAETMVREQHTQAAAPQSSLAT